MASSMMLEEVHTHAQTYIDSIKCCILQHVLAKYDARKSDDSNPCKKSKK